ncbi:MAG: prepilin-type N-terminal cleavage/methylation domain-containing protein [Planctomycetes bacterium]|nr:prepilin-type N-terminal cleavage/methylation domain-containing protein [Planctomycetota bacterium]MBL7042973.1 prepilin-type N-terminal cleavage/methylation domain-containing protein [Pirellulaceae bacterium]
MRCDPTANTATLARNASEGTDRGLHSPSLTRRARVGKSVPRHRGVTLLELMLALALTSLVIVVIGMAIDLHLNALNIERTNVQETMVARAVLRTMANDLRNAVLYEPIDLSGVQEMVAGADLDSMDLGGETQEATGDRESTGDAGGSGDASGMEEADAMGMEEMGLGLDETALSNTADIAGTLEPTGVPGLFGNQYELQVDVSHLPRVDQYEAALSAMAEGLTPDIVSDVKTVAYFLNTDESSMVNVGMADTPMAVGSGIVRRQMDRAMTSFSAQSGTLDPSSGGGDLLAPEVNYLEFRYFDGLEWQFEWDSEEMGGLPVAVEITIGIDPTGGQDPGTLDATEANDLAMADMSEFMYRLVVHLPAAQPTALDEESLDAGSMEGMGL